MMQIITEKQLQEGSFLSIDTPDGKTKYYVICRGMDGSIHNFNQDDFNLIMLLLKYRDSNFLRVKSIVLNLNELCEVAEKFHWMVRNSGFVGYLDDMARIKDKFLIIKEKILTLPDLLFEVYKLEKGKFDTLNRIHEFRIFDNSAVYGYEDSIGGTACYVRFTNEGYRLVMGLLLTSYYNMQKLAKKDISVFFQMLNYHMERLENYSKQEQIVVRSEVKNVSDRYTSLDYIYEQSKRQIGTSYLLDGTTVEISSYTPSCYEYEMFLCHIPMLNLSAVNAIFMENLLKEVENRKFQLQNTLLS